MGFWHSFSASQIASLALFAAAAALALWFVVRSVGPTVQRWRQERRSLADTVWMSHDDTAHPASRSALGHTASGATPAQAAAAGAGRPTALRVLSDAEREAYLLLCTAMPGRIVLAHVPLSRFVRLPRGQAQREWVQRVGALQVDLLLCDTQSRVLAVVTVRAKQDRGNDERASAQRRHQRMVQELRACGIPLHVWHEGAMPSVAAVRRLLAPALGIKHTPLPAPSLIPVAETRESASVFGFSSFEAQDEDDTGLGRSRFEDTVAAPASASTGATGNAKPGAGFGRKNQQRRGAA
jgi:hypothetical protein